MAQFDVYKNSNATTKAAYPYFVDVQSNILSEIASRIVIPLGTLSNFKKQQLESLTPVITYNDEELLLLTPQIASIPVKTFQQPYRLDRPPPFNNPCFCRLCTFRVLDTSYAPRQHQNSIYS